tara:strand:- start:2214 stop:2429 length:216 start_codon:yes stop_codon:yes gene_type:complete
MKRRGVKISPFFLFKKFYYFCKMDHHYIEIITALKKENDELRSSLFELLRRSKISADTKNLILNKHFNGKE